MRKITRKDELL